MKILWEERIKSMYRMGVSIQGGEAWYTKSEVEFILKVQAKELKAERDEILKKYKKLKAYNTN